MTGILLRVLLFAVIGVALFWGAWTGAFKAEDKARLERDRAEREAVRRAPGDQGGLINLKRDKDGKFRPEE
jgi:nitrogen fixation-related uncharacterized protein